VKHSAAGIPTTSPLTPRALAIRRVASSRFVDRRKPVTKA
jgi:hypothetical protein